MPATTYSTVIHWFRRDLRLSDNTALYQAKQLSENVVPAYVLSSWKGSHHWTGAGRQAYLLGCLDSLSKNLEAIDTRLILRSGAAVTQLERLIKETKAEAVFYNRDPDPYGQEVEKQLQELCRSIGIECHGYKDAVMHEPDEVLTKTGTFYRVYTPYSRCWMAQDKPALSPRVKRLGTVPASIDSLPLPGIEHWGMTDMDIDLPTPGEKAARSRLKSAVESTVMTRYSEDRNGPSLDATSGLGPDLRYGTISPRTVFAASQKLMDEIRGKADRESIFAFQKQLAWREFFMAILGNHPEVLETDFNPQWRGLHWDDPGDCDKFERWQQGLTGFPIVDAGMRQLAASGTMHNRVRMITAMFLTKDLHIHWRHGEAHFMRHLLDGEIANNNGGWQWSSGTGADAAPYFRIQNPWTQTERYDPEGTYIKRWLPELAAVDPKRFRKAPEPLDPLAADYPLPVVDHSAERDETLDRFKQHKAKLDNQVA